MEDIMIIRSSFMRRIISQIINKALKKQMPGVEVELKDIHVNWLDKEQKVHLHLELDADVTIAEDAFKDCSGQTVPLVYNHDHSSLDNLIGHALLENRKGGVYAYAKFNDTPTGQTARKCVENGDLNAFSIWANGVHISRIQWRRQSGGQEARRLIFLSRYGRTMH